MTYPAIYLTIHHAVENVESLTWGSGLTAFDPGEVTDWLDENDIYLKVHSMVPSRTTFQINIDSLSLAVLFKLRWYDV